MSLIVQNEYDKEYIIKVSQQIRLINHSKIDWSIQQVLRFASLLKIEQSIKDIIIQWEIDGSKLFDVQYLNANLDCLITQRNYMPFYKLFYVVHAILSITQKDPTQQQQSSNEQISTKMLDQFTMDISDDIIHYLKEQLQQMNNMRVIELGTTQLARMLKKYHMEQESSSVSKWNVDGFSLICIIGNDHQNQNYKNYYSNQEIKLLQRLSHIFLHLYYYQQSIPQLDNNRPPSINNLLDDFGVDFNDIKFDNPIRSSFAQSQYGTSQPGDQKQYQTQQTQPMRTSEYEVPQYGVSEYAVSVRGSMVQSEMGDAIRQSIRNSLAESNYASSQIYQQQSLQASNNKQSNNGKISQNRSNNDNVITVSTVEDDEILASLMTAALKLPFNLLNLEPLQRIKICSITYPFNLNRSNPLSKKQSSSTQKQSSSTQNLTIDTSYSQKSQCIYDLIEEDEEIRQFKVFNLTGAKFGRNPQNDFSYPDELSISGKHAQIVFKDESYYIRDLGSKTGTFVYISEKKPLILVDEQLVQLSYEVEFKVTIIKSELNEGIIKFEFKKPENEPPYRAILKNNNTVRIGRAQNSHIKLMNQGISYYHAQIKYEEGKFIMYDCNTRTGTWLRLSSKGVRSPDRKLTKLDIIRISSKKTFLIQDMSEGIEFSCCPDSKNCHD